MNWTNYHTHTDFCDGEGKPEKYVKAAIEQGISSLGFSGHAPVPFENKWSIKDDDEFRKYCDVVRALKKEYKEKINIHLGLEIDFIPGITHDFRHFAETGNLDYTIGSVHLVKSPYGKQELWFIDGPEEGYINGLKKIFDGDIRKAVESYYKQVCEMVISQRPDIVGHMDKVRMYNKGRFFSEDEKWYKEILMQVVKVIDNNPCIVEVNTRGIYTKKTDMPFPCIEILKHCFMRKIPVTLSSDAHKPEQLTNCFKETALLLKDMGFKEIYFLENGRWKEKKIEG